MKTLVSREVKNGKKLKKKECLTTFAENTEEIIKIIEEGGHFDIIITCEKNPETLKNLLKLILESKNGTELILSDEHVVPMPSVAILP